MRLLSKRPDHAGDRAAQEEQESERPGYRHGHVGQSLPLRNVSANSSGHPSGREATGCEASGCEGDGMKLIENVSRRGFLEGTLAAGVFILGARLIPEALWAAEGEAAPAPLQPSLWVAIA